MPMLLKYILMHIISIIYHYNNYWCYYCYNDYNNSFLVFFLLCFPPFNNINQNVLNSSLIICFDLRLNIYDCFIRLDNCAKEGRWFELKVQKKQYQIFSLKYISLKLLLIYYSVIGCKLTDTNCFKMTLHL